MATNTKIIKLTNGTLTYVPVTVAAAVQYDYGTNSYTSVQEAIGITAGSVNDHITTGISLTKAANSYNISLSGAHNATGSVSIEGGAYISIDNTTANKFVISGYNIAKNDHNHNIGFTGDITLSSTPLGTSLSPTVNKSTNIKGGGAKKIAYQTGADTTGFINAPTASGQVLKYNGTTIDWGTDEDHKLTSASITPKSSAESVAVTTYSVDVLKSETITMSGSNGESVTANNVKHYSVPTQNAIDKAKAEAIAHADSLVISAMNYRGVTSTTLTDGATTKPITINNESITPKNGDIVLSGAGADKKEYIWNGNSWNELGDSSAKANKTIKIISDNTAIVVTDETLADDVHITHETTSAGTSNPQASNKDVTGTTGQQKVITGITVNSYGHVTSYTAADIYSKNTLYYSGNEITIDSSNNHINHNTHSVSNVTPSDKDVTGSTNKQKVITGLTINEYGHITAYTAANIYSTDTPQDQTHAFVNKTAGTSGNYELNLSGSNSKVYFVPSNGIQLTTTDKDKLTIAHANTGKTKTEGLYKFAVDDQGHVTAGSAPTIKVTPHDSGLKVKIGPDTTNDFSLFADSQFTQTISLADLTQVTATIS